MITSITVKNIEQAIDKLGIIPDPVDHISIHDVVRIINILPEITGDYVITTVCKEDLEDAGFITKNITSEEMERLAAKLSDDYCEQLFWLSLKILGEEYFNFPKIPTN